MVLFFLFNMAIANNEPPPWLIGEQHNFEMNYLGKKWFCKHKFYQSQRDINDALNISCLDEKAYDFLKNGYGTPTKIEVKVNK